MVFSTSVLFCCFHKALSLAQLSFALSFSYFGAKMFTHSCKGKSKEVALYSSYFVETSGN